MPHIISFFLDDGTRRETFRRRFVLMPHIISFFLDVGDYTGCEGSKLQSANASYHFFFLGPNYRGEIGVIVEC